MPVYMLDTDISSYIMKRSNPSVLQKLATLATADVCISAIIQSELAYGIAVSPRKQRDRLALEDFLRQIQILDYPAAAAAHYAEIRAHLKLAGTLIGANDMLIAAHARSLDLTLVTNNTREFHRVPNLKLENWSEPTA